MDKVREITLKKHPLPESSFQVGDSVRVSLCIKEANKERIQAFEGTLLKIQGKDFQKSITIRKISFGVGVEKTIPLVSPNISKIEVISRFKVRRARLFYLRKLKGRESRLKARN